MTESNFKAFKLRWSIRGVHFTCCCYENVYEILWHTANKLFKLFLNHVILKPAMAFAREGKKNFAEGKF